MGTGNILLRVTLQWISRPSRVGGGGGGVAILLVASWYKTWVKLCPCGPLRLKCDFTLPWKQSILN